MQRFVGLVIGTASRKTCKVCVERLFTHPRYHKVLRLKKNYLVDDPEERAIVGDLVSLQYYNKDDGRKISSQKAFRLLEVLKEGRRYRHPITGQVYTAPAVRPPAEDWQKLLIQ